MTLMKHFICLNLCISLVSIAYTLPNTISIGTTLPVDQDEGELIQYGINAYLSTIKDNNITLITYDDNKRAFEAIKNIETLLKKTPIILNPFTTNVIYNLPETITKQPLLIFGPDENTTIKTPQQYPYIIHTKPPIYQELEILIDYAITIEKRSMIALFYVNDATGISDRNDAREILAKYNLKPVAESRHPRRTVEVEKAVKKFSKIQPDVIICLSRRHATNTLILQALNKGLAHTTFMGTSYLQPLQEQLKKQRGVNFIATSVVPDPKTSTLEIAQEYRSLLHKSDQYRYNTISFSAFINTAILTHLMQKVTEPTNPQILIQEAQQLNAYNFKGLTLTFNTATRSLLSTIWLIPNINKPWQLTTTSPNKKTPSRAIKE